jgi:hypothetical protein
MTRRFYALLAFITVVIMVLVGCGPSAQPNPVSAPLPEWMVYNTDNSRLPGNRLTPALAFDAQGNKWIGTNGGGLAAYREGGVIPTGVKE